MGMLLAADDISAGDFVTIHSPEPKVLRNLLHAGHEPPSGPHLMPLELPARSQHVRLEIQPQALRRLGPASKRQGLAQGNQHT